MPKQGPVIKTETEQEEKRFVLPKHRFRTFFNIVTVLLLLGSIGFGVRYVMQHKNLIQLTNRTTPKPITATQLTETTEIPGNVPVETFEVADGRVMGEEDGSSIENPTNLPASESFAKFNYDQAVGKALNLMGNCRDTYYTVLIFNSSDDYKTDPTKARLNQAYDCPLNNTYEKLINLKDFNLPTGEYYFLVADQGATGTWYNPR